MAMASPVGPSLKLPCSQRKGNLRIEKLDDPAAGVKVEEAHPLHSEAQDTIECVCLLSITTDDPMLPQLRCICHMLLVPILLSVEVNVKAVAPEIPHVSYFVSLQLAGI